MQATTTSFGGKGYTLCEHVAKSRLRCGARSRMRPSKPRTASEKRVSPTRESIFAMPEAEKREQEPWGKSVEGLYRRRMTKGSEHGWREVETHRRC